VRVKTLHGSFPFAVQRLGEGEEATSWLEKTAQVRDGYVSERLAGFSAYYSNRLSYEDVSELLERVTGAPVLSDQKIQQRVVAEAVAVSQQWERASATASGQTAEVRVAEQVDWYDAEADEVLVLADGICVKQQKPTRSRSGAQQEPMPTVRVNTDIWLVERPSGGFEYLTAGIDAGGAEALSGAQQVQEYIVAHYSGRSAALPVVAISDGARTIRCQLERLFGQAVPLILEWYHLEKKMWDLMSMIARSKAEKESHVHTLLGHLWRGRVTEALTYLRTAVVAKNTEQLTALITYLEKHLTEIIDYERRQRTGKVMGSGRIEKGVDQVIGVRQKGKGISWSSVGSKALGILKVVELNGQWEQHWFPEQAAA
jgi:Uncharacterised protein family (UPF0236)